MLVAAGVALGDGLGVVGVSLGEMLVAMDVASGVTDGVAVGVEVVQAPLIVIATSKTTSAIDLLVTLLFGLWAAS